MLHNLAVLNGELSPTFDENNDTYTVLIKSDINELKMTYTIDEEVNVEIKGNENLTFGENTVLIEVGDKEGNITTYTLLVTKEEEKTTSAFVLEPKPIEVKKELPGYTVPLIASICFFLILIAFRIIFVRKKHKN